VERLRLASWRKVFGSVESECEFDWLEVFGGGDLGAAGVPVVVGGCGTMAGRSVGFDSLLPCSPSLFWPTVLILLPQP
jgi:hypothetical protein